MLLVLVLAWLRGAVAAEAPVGGERVWVYNESGGAVGLLVDGVGVGALAAGRSRELVLPAGRHAVEAVYPAFGVQVPIVERSVWVRPGWTGAVHIPAPRTTAVQVTNHTGAAAEVFVNGVGGLQLTANEAGVVEVPVGPGLVELRRADGRLVDREAVEAVAFAPLDLVATADFGALELSNPSDVPLVVRVAGQSLLLPAGGTGRIDGLPIGPQAVELRGVGGWPCGGETVAIGAEAPATLRLPTPVNDAVVLVSTLPAAGAVWVDGLEGGALAAGGRIQLDLAPGRHRLAVKNADGERVFSAVVRVARGARQTLTVDADQTRRPAPPRRPTAPR